MTPVTLLWKKRPPSLYLFCQIKRAKCKEINDNILWRVMFRGQYYTYLSLNIFLTNYKTAPHLLQYYYLKLRFILRFSSFYDFPFSANWLRKSVSLRLFSFVPYCTIYRWILSRFSWSSSLTVIRSHITFIWLLYQ